MSDTEIYNAGWSDSSAAIVRLWEFYKENAGGRTEAFEKFDNFMSMVSLRLSGGTDQDLIDLANLQGDAAFVQAMKERNGK